LLKNLLYLCLSKMPNTSVDVIKLFLEIGKKKFHLKKI